MKKSHSWSLNGAWLPKRIYTISHKPDCWCRISLGSVAGRFRRFLWCDCQYKWARTSWDDRQLYCSYFKRQKRRGRNLTLSNYEPAGLKVKDSVLFKGPKQRRMSLGPKKWYGHWFWISYTEVSTMFFITFLRIKKEAEAEVRKLLVPLGFGKKLGTLSQDIQCYPQIFASMEWKRDWGVTVGTKMTC